MPGQAGTPDLALNPSAWPSAAGHGGVDAEQHVGVAAGQVDDGAGARERGRDVARGLDAPQLDHAGAGAARGLADQPRALALALRADDRRLALLRAPIRPSAARVSAVKRVPFRSSAGVSAPASVPHSNTERLPGAGPRRKAACLPCKYTRCAQHVQLRRVLPERRFTHAVTPLSRASTVTGPSCP